jgi:two-component system response regulator RpaA
VYGAGYCLEVPTGDQLANLQPIIEAARSERQQEPRSTATAIRPEGDGSEAA